MVYRRILVVLLSVLTSPLFAQTQEGSKWELLKQLKHGERTEVFDMRLRKTQGRFLRLSDDSIVLMTSKGEISIPRGDVLRVAARGRVARSHLWAGALRRGLSGIGCRGRGRLQG